MRPACRGANVAVGVKTLALYNNSYPLIPSDISTAFNCGWQRMGEGLVRQLLVLLALGVLAAAAPSPRGSGGGWVLKEEKPRGAKQRALAAADWRATVTNATVASFLRRAAAPNGAVIFTTFSMMGGASHQDGESSWRCGCPSAPNSAPALRY